jgi:hypothetical protein
MNMVNETFELAAVICRLAGRPEYSLPEFGAFNTDYHKEVVDTFAAFENHDAVKYAKELSHIICYEKVLQFVVHIIKKDGKFVFIDDINSLFVSGWNEKYAKEFLNLFNMFYNDTNYFSFYNSHLNLFEKSTMEFIDDSYGEIDFEWFRKYVDPSNLRCIYSLSSGNYSATVNDKIIYCLVHCHGTEAIVHEYCHSFANPLAHKWYSENAIFKRWCDDSVNQEKMPFYNNGWKMAYEYVTRAYVILYNVQHNRNLNDLLLREKDVECKDAFKYIEEVYNMIQKIKNV